MSSPSPFVIILNDDGTYTLHVAPDVDSLMTLAAKGVVFWGQKAIERRGVFHIALSGGNTPRALYELLATEAYARQLYWDRVHVWWGDERPVPSDHHDSNYHMAQGALISKVPLLPQNVHRVRTELGPMQAAAHYETEIMFAFELMRIEEDADAILMQSESRPRFDLILLGMGDDGHTASLFPETEALHVQDRLVVANAVAKLATDRITFTYPLINSADSVMFLVSGEKKADVLRQVLLGDIQPEALPAQGVMPSNGKLMWMTDATAAMKIAAGPGYPPQEFIYRRIAA